MPARVILAYANDTSDSLKFLESENETVHRYLNRMDAALVSPIQRPKVTIENLFAEFSDRGEGITIFHFSGHAGQFQLLFDKGELVDGRGIAKLMRAAPNIEIVFLNGCATKDLIAWFHQAGVKIVIATSRKVFDKFAAEFSIKFYSSLSQFFTVGEAFDFAKAYMIAVGNENPEQEAASRHIATDSLEDGDNDFPYGIYYKKVESKEQAIGNNPDDYELYEKWRFKDNQDFPELYNPCVELLKCIGEKGIVLANFLAAYNQNARKEIQEFADLHEQYEVFANRNPQTIFEADALSRKVIDLLPEPLGIIMRQMICEAREIQRGRYTQYKELLKYQLHFHDVLVKMSCFTMLSDLYEVHQKKQDEKKKLEEVVKKKIEIAGAEAEEEETLVTKEEVKRKDFYFDTKTHEAIKKLLSLEENDVIDFNYRELIRNIREQIIRNDEKPFIAEYTGGGSYIPARDFDMAHEIIKTKRKFLASDKIKAGWVSHCKSVEDELCNIFKEVFFILRYNLLVVRNVEAIRVRFKEDRTYQHRIWLLRVSGNLDKPEYDIVNKCTENYSVILVKGLNSIIDYLSLSPFVIDKCVLTNVDSPALSGNNASQLFYYSHFNNGVLVYEGVEDARERIEIEIKTEVQRRFIDGMPVEKEVKYIPYVEEIARGGKNNSLDKEKATIRLEMIYEQFLFFKEAIENLSYKQANNKS
jgi:hypothetical protein